MSDVIIRWEEPPEHGNRASRRLDSKYQSMVDALRARPGEWAVVFESDSLGSCGSFSSRVKQGKGPFGPTGAFEATIRGPVTGPARVYARYVGGAS